MTTYTIIRNILEIIYFLSAPAVAWFAWKALSQIQVSREIATTQAKRESCRIAAEKIKEFAEEIIPKINEFKKLKAQGMYPLLSAIKIEESWPQVKCETDNAAGLLKEVFTHDGLIVYICNKMEGFAIFFTCGIADTNIAYQPISSVFCNAAKSFLP